MPHTLRRLAQSDLIHSSNLIFGCSAPSPRLYTWTTLSFVASIVHCDFHICVYIQGIPSVLNFISLMVVILVHTALILNQPLKLLTSILSKMTLSTHKTEYASFLLRILQSLLWMLTKKKSVYNYPHGPSVNCSCPHLPTASLFYLFPSLGDFL